MGVRPNATLLTDQASALSGQSGHQPADDPAESVENDGVDDARSGIGVP